MGRTQVNFETIPARLPKGTLKAIDKALEKGESKAEFLRAAVQAELDRRAASKRK